MRRPRPTFNLLALAILSMSGCSLLAPAAVVPLQTVGTLRGPEHADALVVFVPGFGDGPADFENYGFFETLKRINPRVDAVAANAHFGYYQDFSVIKRLREDIITPAKAQGYQKIWLVGISMGGFGSLTYGRRHPEDIAGIIALAPFMGNSTVIDDVKDAGGLAAWEPPPLPKGVSKQELEYQILWRWLKGYAQPTPEPSSVTAEGRPALYVGYGTKDPLRTPNQLVGEVLPVRHVAMRVGGHKWAVWRPLFVEFARDALSPAALRYSCSRPDRLMHTFSGSTSSCPASPPLAPSMNSTLRTCCRFRSRISTSWRGARFPWTPTRCSTSWSCGGAAGFATS